MTSDAPNARMRPVHIDGDWYISVDIDGEEPVLFGPCESRDHAEREIAAHGGAEFWVAMQEGGDA
jgi:hypothetical protein